MLTTFVKTHFVKSPRHLFLFLFSHVNDLRKKPLRKSPKIIFSRSRSLFLFHSFDAPQSNAGEQAMLVA